MTDITRRSSGSGSILVFYEEDKLNKKIQAAFLSLTCMTRSHESCGIVNCAHRCDCRCHLKKKCKVCKKRLKKIYGNK